MMQRVVIIAAVAEDWTIGDEGGMPWHRPRDLERFRELTMNRPVIMGRRTFESVGGLDGRHVIVLSETMDKRTGAVMVARSPGEALGLATRREGCEVYVAGGAQVYELFGPDADELRITEVPGEYAGDTKFPRHIVEDQSWREAHRTDPDGSDLEFVTYVR